MSEYNLQSSQHLYHYGCHTPFTHRTKNIFYDFIVFRIKSASFNAGQTNKRTTFFKIRIFLMSVPAHPQSNQQSMMDFPTLDSDIADGPMRTCPPLQTHKTDINSFSKVWASLDVALFSKTPLKEHVIVKYPAFPLKHMRFRISIHTITFNGCCLFLIRSA